jgi:hypothetical protein
VTSFSYEAHHCISESLAKLSANTLVPIMCCNFHTNYTAREWRGEEYRYLGLEVSKSEKKEGCHKKKCLLVSVTPVSSTAALFCRPGYVQYGVYSPKLLRQQRRSYLAMQQEDTLQVCDTTFCHRDPRRHRNTGKRASLGDRIPQPIGLEFR